MLFQRFLFALLLLGLRGIFVSFEFSGKSGILVLENVDGEELALAEDILQRFIPCPLLKHVFAAYFGGSDFFLQLLQLALQLKDSAFLEEASFSQQSFLVLQLLPFLLHQLVDFALGPFQVLSKYLDIALS